MTGGISEAGLWNFIKGCDRRAMSRKRLVSVIISSYNFGRFLREAVDSALAQTYPHIEVIVADDGSTDDSRQLITAYGFRITAVLLPHEGPPAAINAGYALSH